MSDKNYELELYKLIITPDEQDSNFSYVSELGWVNDNEFCVWIYYWDVEEFVKRLKEIFGYRMFDDGGFDANMQNDGICIVLNEALDGYDMDFETIFPKEKYSH